MPPSCSPDSAKPRCSAPVRNRLAALRALASPRDATLVVRATLVMAAVPVLMRLPPSRLAEVLERVPIARRSHRRSAERAGPVVDALLRLVRPAVRRSCQLRGVTLYYLLRRAGHDVQLAFGVADSPDFAAGHCWLTVGGEPYLERRDPRPVFVELLRIPRAPLREASA